METKDISLGKTSYWDKKEYNLIYMFSEFIDNAKAAYEDEMKINSNYLNGCPIDIEFNRQKNYISISDFAGGFEVIKKLEQKGINEIQKNDNGQYSTNQYFEGMKDAMNFFGNYSIVVSERKIENNDYERKCNFFIFGVGLAVKDVALKPTRKTGTQIFLCADRNAFNDVWSSLDFVNEEDKNIDIIATPDKHSKTSLILAKLTEVFPYITGSLFERYSPLVNKNNEIVINFLCIDDEGNDLWKDENDVPAWYRSIKKNEYEKLVSFSFSKFREDNPDFYNLFESNKEFRDLFTKYITHSFYYDLDLYMKSFADDTGESNKYNMSKLPEFTSDNSFEVSFDPSVKINDEKFNNYPFAKKFFVPFINMLLSGNGNYDGVKFTINNLILNDKSRIIQVNDGTEQNVFSVSYNWLITNDQYHDDMYEKIYGNTYDTENLTGFKLIENNRAIYHGPNYAKDDISGKKYPQNLLVDYLEDRNSSLMKECWKRYTGTKVILSSNHSVFNYYIRGSITINNDDVFTAAPNKSQIDNALSLTDYTQNLLEHSGFSVLAKWSYVLKNSFNSEKLLNKNEFDKRIKFYMRHPGSEPNDGPIDAFYRSLAINKLTHNGEFNFDDIKWNPSGTSYNSDVKYGDNLFKEVNVKDDYSAIRQISTEFAKRNSFNNSNVSSIDEPISKNEKTNEYEIDFSNSISDALGHKFNSLKINVSKSSDKKIDINYNEPSINIVFELKKEDFVQEEIGAKLVKFSDGVYDILDNIKGFFDVKNSLNEWNKPEADNVEKYFKLKLENLCEAFNE